MEPAKIDWKRVDSRYVCDEVYERINAPKWADLTAADDPAAVDDAWFCRPDCRHPKTAEDFLLLSPSPKAKLLRSSSEVRPFGEWNANQRDGNLKRRGGVGAFLPSPSRRESPKLKQSLKKYHREDLENQDPNLCSSYTTPPSSSSKAVPKITKEVIEANVEKRVEEVDEEWRQNKPHPRLKSTLSARNLFAGKDILGQISEFCQEIKRLIAIKDSPAPQEEIKEETEKRLEMNSKLDARRKGSPLKKGEKSPLLKESVRSCPPTPQRFPSPSMHRLRSTRANAATSSPLNKSSKSTTPLLMRGSEQKRGILRDLVQSSEENSAAFRDGTEGKSMDLFWFLKPCTYLAK